MKRSILIVCFLKAVIHLSAQVQDSTFGVLGSFVPGVLNFYSTTACDFDGRADQSFSAIHLEDGRIVLAGYTNGADGNDFAIARLLPDGKYDETAGPEGEFRIDLGYQNDSCLAAALYQSDRILMGGCVTLPGMPGYVNLIAKVNLDGVLDTSFGNGGHSIIDLPSANEMITKILPLPDGKIIVLGNALFGQPFYTPDSVAVYISRLSPNGQIDSTFGSNGVVYLRWKQESNASLFGDAILDANGRIILTGGAYHPYPFVFNAEFISSHNIVVCRYLPDGQPDNSFGINGKRELLYTGTAYGTALNLYEDGRILLAGVVGNVSSSQPYYTYVTRLMPDGSTDFSFGDNGSFNKFVIGAGNGSEPVGIVRVQNKIVLGIVDTPTADHYACGALCLKEDGTIDSTFGEKGVYLYFKGFYPRYFINQISSTTPNSFFLSGYYRVLFPNNMVIIKIKLDETSNVFENTAPLRVRLAPNPATDFIRLLPEGADTLPGVWSLTLFNSVGKEVLLIDSPDLSDLVPIKHLPTGIYYYLLETQNGSAAGRFFKE